MKRKNFKLDKGAFPCGDCGKAFSTAEKFSDHVHECLVNPVEWGRKVEDVNSKSTS